MDSVDRRLHLVWPWLVLYETRSDKRLAFNYERAIPPAAVLLAEGDEHFLARCAGAASGLFEKHQREQPARLRLARHQLDEQTPEADRFARHVFAHQPGPCGCRVSF